MTEPHQQESEIDRSRGVDLDFSQSSSIQETEAERAAREPLFNKRKMIIWAVATFAVWMSLSYIVPIAFQSAKEAVKLSLRPGVQGGVRTIVLPNGKTITVTTTTDAKGHTSTVVSTGRKTITIPGEAVAAPKEPTPPVGTTAPAAAPPAPSAKK